MGKIKSYVKLARPHQYVKNGFIFLPLFFGHKLYLFGAAWNTCLAFICFSMAASCVYIFNDIRDIDSDRNHPAKKYRPLASGQIKKTEALVFLGVLLVFAVSISAVFLDTLFLSVLITYLLLNVLYSLGMKHISLIDITFISAGFVLRVFAGAVAADVQISQWIILMTFLLALFLSLSKRRDDVLLCEHGVNSRKSIDGYTLEFISTGMVTMAAVTIVCYILYTVSPEVASRHNSKNLYLTSFWVILGMLRYMQITFVEEKTGSPTQVLLKDFFLQAVIVLWLATFFIIFYIRNSDI
ncbi:MAG: decaprenyl-phosphate phosphoribosyltransferase [Desulfobacterales bacterium]|nr:decaprenyl-phosphate phosphoribosyltransferase [Desulfobacterales bacterium]